MLFKTDENMPREVADYLVQSGHDALRVDEQGLSGSTDPRVAAVCQAEGRTLVTLDTDFMDVRSFPPEEFAGIIILRPHRQSIPQILDLTRRFVPLLEIEKLAGKLWIVDHGRLRIRPDEP